MIHHVAIWVFDLERMRDFYVRYFGGVQNSLYHNPQTQFQSYFLSFGNGAELELMQIPTVDETRNNVDKQFTGYAHIAFSAGSKENVDKITKLIVEDGYILAGEPRTTGDGFYESCIFDPELNRVEITV